ncbi:MAG: RDD family protein [Pseudomonadota bacterium]
MFCSKCGELASQDAKFCAKCGAVLPSAQPPAPPVAIPAIDISSPSAQVRPWVRYWARMFDVYSFSLIGGVFLGIAAPQFLARQNEYALGMMLVFAWVFVEALLLSSFQTTPGKWLFKTNIALTSGSPIGFSQALTRSLKVWWRGFGTGFPIAAMITMIIAHGRLTRNGITSWDKDDSFLISHEKIGVPRVLAAVAFFFVFLVIVGIGKSANA